eukprot:954024_1
MFSRAFSVSRIATFGGLAGFWAFNTSRAAHAESSPEYTGGLNPRAFREHVLLEKRPFNHNSAVYRFAFDDVSQKMKMPVAGYILTRIKKDGKWVKRPYTPISDETTKGYFELLIKTYPDGAMSSHIASLKEGEALEIRGPFKKLLFRTNMKKRIGMIAGGTGITPMLQPPKSWQYGVGYTSDNDVQRYMPAPSDDSLILVCGPPGMMKAISGGKAKDYSQGELSGILKTLGYTKDMVFKC